MRSPGSTTSLWLLCFLLVSVLPGAVLTRADDVNSFSTSATISKGWHPWYEIKVDPENAKNLIVCGTKWDVTKNTPLGFVYFSPDGGSRWESVLEDGSSTGWVTEHSCAFGPNHRAYFVSGDSRVVDGIPHHEFGKTTVYVSSDAGRHWMQSTTTGWADYSSSAVSARSHRLFTFYNSFDKHKRTGQRLGKRNCAGGFFAAGQRPARAVLFPYDAEHRLPRCFSLRRNRFEERRGGGFVLWRQPQSDGSILASSMLMMKNGRSSRRRSSRTCPQNLATGRLIIRWRTIDNSNPLFAIYVNGCGDRTELILAVSDDEGKTWSRVSRCKRWKIRWV